MPLRLSQQQSLDPEGVSEMTGIAYTGNFAGETPDERLDAALNERSRVILEAADYTADRTFDAGVQLHGFGGATYQQGSTARVVGAQWDVQSSSVFSGFHIREGAELLLNTADTLVREINLAADITVAGNRALIYGILNGTVTFQSNTHSSIIDTSVGVSITDNGSNTVGDIA